MKTSAKMAKQIAMTERSLVRWGFIVTLMKLDLADEVRFEHLVNK